MKDPSDFFPNYTSNLALYPVLQQYFRDAKLRLLGDLGHLHRRHDHEHLGDQ